MRALLDVNVLIALLERLAAATAHPKHKFWPADVSVLDESLIRYDHILGHRQITDCYLLALAVTHGGRFVTLDGRVPLQSVKGAQPAHMAIIV